MATACTLTTRTIAQRFKEVKSEDDLWGEIGVETRRLVKRILESSLEEELLERLGAARYQRCAGRQGWRNGHYTRWLVTRWGLLDVAMPRARRALPESQVLAHFQRHEAQVEQLIRDAFLRGVSTREVGAVLEPVLGWRPSAQCVSRVCRTLDAAVRHFHWRLLDDHWGYLFLDGVTMRVKHPGGVATKLVLVAYGLRPDGERQVVDYRLATAESAAQWEAFLADLARRGLAGTHLRLVITDGCPGLHAALALVYAQVPLQRCWVHKLRNLAAKLPRRHRAACLRGAYGIAQAAHGREAGQRFRAWAAQWRGPVPAAVRCLEQDLEELLAFYQCPQEDWVRVRTTNAIERVFREVRRRTRPMSCFQNSASCDRIIYAVITHVNERGRNARPRLSTQAS